MISELSGSIVLSVLPKPAFAVRSNFGLSDAERLVRKLSRC